MDRPDVTGENASDAQALTAATNELFQRIGRNLVNFQKIEGMLKFLLAFGRISGPISELAAIRDSQIIRLSATTLGGLVGKLSDAFLSDASNPDEIPDDAKEPWLQIRVSFESAEESLELRRGLEALVVERNELAHHLLSKWDTKSVEATRRLSDELDTQRERLIPVFNRLWNLVIAVQDGAKAQMAFLASREGGQQLEMVWLQGSPVVTAMREYLTRHSRADGWLALATAGHHLKRDLPEHVGSLRKIYGHSTLRRLLASTNLFEIRDEPTPKGLRTVFRLAQIDPAA